jgi:hypothetical protein
MNESKSINHNHITGTIFVAVVVVGTTREMLVTVAMAAAAASSLAISGVTCLEGPNADQISVGI